MKRETEWEEEVEAEQNLKKQSSRRSRTGMLRRETAIFSFLFNLILRLFSIPCQFIIGTRGGNVF